MRRLEKVRKYKERRLMASWRRTGLIITITTSILLVFVFSLPGPAVLRAAPLAQDTSQGQAIYEERCAACHGLNGDGQGPAAASLFVKPRDFTRDEYEIKSTAGDEFPSREDLVGVIANGMPGSSMPAWRGVLSEAEIGAVADYVQTFGRFFSQEGYGATLIETPRRVRSSAESIARGRELYVGEIECARCHGNAGRGDGPSAFELTDNAGNVIYPADLTQPWHFRGGGAAEDIYLRLHTGMTGTPMPSFADSLAEEDTWHLVNYILSLSPETPPEPAVLLVSHYLAGPLPANLDDPAWAEVEPAYYPLTGQIMRSPRHYQPSINAVTIRSLYNDAEMALYVTWNDRTETRQGEAVDALAIQFPQALAAGDERPYFVFGDAARAVYQWYWSADSDRVVERTANGPDTITEQAEAQWQTTGSARYQDGQWQLLFRRPLQTGDSGDLALATDLFMPIAFMVWDGFADESGLRLGLTTWSQLFLPRPTPLTRYTWVPVVMVAVAAAESLLVWRVRRADRSQTTG
jgi:DMSO reductase family type II enzyme heme b subunit